MTDIKAVADDGLWVQAKKIIGKFGGARRLARILETIGKPRDPVNIYRWMYPKSRGGSDGIIPTAALPDVIAAARFEGIHISSEDLDPRPNE